MKKNLALLLLLGVVILTATQCKKKDDPQSDPTAKYAVSYQFLISGDYKDLKIEYFEPGMVKKEVTNPAVPWQMSSTTFSPGDSVELMITFTEPIGDIDYEWTWNIYATNGTTTLDYSNHQHISGTNSSETPVVINAWKGKLP
ncbi:hypothetical protein ACFLS7_05950 [Bacteroidota bacterium]